MALKANQNDPFLFGFCFVKGPSSVEIQRLFTDACSTFSFSATMIFGRVKIYSNRAFCCDYLKRGEKKINFGYFKIMSRHENQILFLK